MKVTIVNSTFLMLNMLVVYKKGKPNTFFLLPRNGIYSLTQCNPFPIYVIFVHTQSSLVPPPHHTEPNVNPGHQCSVFPGLKVETPKLIMVDDGLQTPPRQTTDKPKEVL